MSNNSVLDISLQKSLDDLNMLQGNLEQLQLQIEDIKKMPKKLLDTKLQITDILFVLMAGVTGGIFSSSDKLDKFLDKIHESSSKKDSFAGKLFHHVGDYIDRPNGDKFLTRGGTNPEVPFHRVLFGHDVFSIRSDNPFLVTADQYGLLKGVTQAVRHLIADTFSKQGLPLPGHSFFDFTKDNGGTGNYLIELTKKITKDAKLANPGGEVIKHGEAFNHLFTLRMQDLASHGITWGLCQSYFKACNIKDKIRKSQIKILAYFISFVTNFFVGMKKTGGIPYINWPTLVLLVKEIASFYHLNWMEIRELEQITVKLVSENKQIEAMVYETGSSLVSYESGIDYILEIEKQAKIYANLVDFFEEDL
ncbi:hypothetical protein [Neobacillus sp. YIM B06451]|uniref:hypothetical protein n=1 Tax=Neobacillus sp. YIM B06451 TaxID=3070994 RepID=UPI00292DA768|nr:hypothetical protein [Neobacillus sp. YIM B06451]